MEGEGDVTAREALEFLASRRRTVLLGGAAVILHGMNRMTKDYDIWLDPLPDPKAWASGIVELLEAAPFLQARRIATIAGRRRSARRRGSADRRVLQAK